MSHTYHLNYPKVMYVSQWGGRIAMELGVKPRSKTARKPAPFRPLRPVRAAFSRAEIVSTAPPLVKKRLLNIPSKHISLRSAFGSTNSLSSSYRNTSPGGSRSLLIDTGPWLHTSGLAKSGVGASSSTLGFRRQSSATTRCRGIWWPSY